MSVKRPRRVVSCSRRVGAIVLVGTGLLVTTVGCSARPSTNATGPPPTDVTVVTVVLTIQQTGPVGTTPSQARQVASAVDCRVSSPREVVPGGPTYLVRLKVGTDQLTSSLAALGTLRDVFDVHTEDVASFSATPTNIGAGGTAVC